jgi:hypothetical protein
MERPNKTARGITVTTSRKIARRGKESKTDPNPVSP